MPLRSLLWVPCLSALLVLGCSPPAGPEPEPDPEAVEDGDAEAPEQTAVLALRAGGVTLRELGFTDGDVGEDGTPDFLAGDWDAGATGPADLEGLLQGPLREALQLPAESAYPLSAFQKDDDDPAVSLFTLQQTYRGVPVDGALVSFEVDDRGHVLAMLSQLAPKLQVDTTPRVDGTQALTQALAGIGPGAALLSLPELRVVAWAGPPGQLAWHALMQHRSPKGPVLGDLYVDAVTGKIIGRTNRNKTALNRTVYDLMGLCTNDAGFDLGLPGMLLLREGGQTADGAGRAVYDNLGHVYRFYLRQLGQDSYDGNGAELIASVHVTFGPGTCTDDNAAWLGLPPQMVYGDALARALDVTGHELTHAFIDSLEVEPTRRDRLDYLYEAGALNEAMADIFGAGVEAWREAGGDDTHNPAPEPSSRTWLIGEDSTGGAFRSMRRPAERQQPDHYRDIDRDGCKFKDRMTCCTIFNDHCGVHQNSGIANLAFYLLSEGGTHPGGSGPRVSGVGMGRALRIFYRSRGRWLPDMTFRQMRHATAAAARRSGCGSWRSVQRAWTAVGVPGARVRCPAAGG